MIEDFGNAIVRQMQKNLNKWDKTLLYLKITAKYTPTARNTHSCPKEGIKNFEYDPKLPRSYPGWSGRVWAGFSGCPPGFSDSAFTDSGLYAGSGGGGTYSVVLPKMVTEHCYPVGYDCIIYEQDFPDYQLEKLLKVYKEDQPFKYLYMNEEFCEER